VARFHKFYAHQIQQIPSTHNYSHKLQLYEIKCSYAGVFWIPRSKSLRDCKTEEIYESAVHELHSFVIAPKA